MTVLKSLSILNNSYNVMFCICQYALLNETSPDILCTLPFLIVNVVIVSEQMA